MSENELEELRLKIVRKYIFTSIFLVLSIVSVIYIFSSMMKSHGIDNIKVIMTLVCILLSIIFVFIYLSIKKDYTRFCKEFKRVFVFNALKKRFTNLVYSPKNGMPKSVIWATHMLELGEDYASNDMISGKYKNTNFMQADVKIRDEYTYTDNNGNTHSYYIDIFYGKWLVFEFNKRFKYNVQVREKGFKYAKVDSDYSKYGYEKVQMENELFNRKFNVYTEKEHDAFYLLTPHMMERIMKINDIIKGDLLLCFIDNELHIGLNNHVDSFEPKIFKSIRSLSLRVNKDIELITSFIDELDLSNDLFRKEV